MADDLADKIEAAADQPKSASIDGNAASARDLRELIEADKYLRANEAARSGGRGFSLARFKPPGAA